MSADRISPGIALRPHDVESSFAKHEPLVLPSSEMADLAPSLRKSLLTVLTSDAYNPMLPIVRAEERPRFNVCSEQYAEVLRQCSVQAGDVEVDFPCRVRLVVACVDTACCR